MGRTCPNCGKTRIDLVKVSCPTCGQLLPVGGHLVTGRPRPPSARPIITLPSGRRYYLSEHSDNRIGRVGCAILLSDPTIPDHSATLRPEAGGGFVLHALSPSVHLNGLAVTKDIPLRDGDTIVIGRTTLTYSGPSAALSVPKAPSKIRSKTPPVSFSAPFPLKDWGTDPPTVEGTVQFHNGPHRLEDDQMLLRILGAVALGMIRAWLAMLPMQMRREMHVWNFRVKDIRASTQENIILIKKEPTEFISLGDFVAIWGPRKTEGILLEEAYIYNTNSELHVKKRRKR